MNKRNPHVLIDEVKFSFVSYRGALEPQSEIANSHQKEK